MFLTKTMSSLTPSEKQRFEHLLGMMGGYVLDFSNSSFADLFSDVTGIDIYQEKYSIYGDSKAKRLRCFWEIEPDRIVGKVLSEMLGIWENRNRDKITDPDYVYSRKTISRLLMEELDEIEAEILAEAYSEGSLLIHVISADQIPGEWIRIGKKNFIRKDSPEFHLRYREALDCLVTKGYVVLRSANLYHLTGNGALALKNHKSATEIKPNFNPRSPLLVVPTSADSKDRKIIDLLHKYYVAPVVVGSILLAVGYYYFPKGSAGNQSAIVGDYSEGDKIEGNKISGQNVVINNFNNNELLENHEQSSLLKTKIKVERIVEDFSVAVAEIKKEYAAESAKISADFASRGVYNSGGHVAAYIQLAKSKKISLDKARLMLNRGVQDALVEGGRKPDLDLMSGDFEKQKKLFSDAQVGYIAACNYLNSQTKSQEQQIMGQVRIAKDFDVLKE